MEDVEKEDTKKNRSGIIDGAVIALILTALAITLSYAYNAGYLYYYGVPLFLCTSSYSGLLMKSALITDIVQIIVYPIIAITVICKFIRFSRKTDLPKPGAVKRIIIAMLVLLAICLFGSIFMLFRAKSVSSTVTIVMLLLEFLYFLRLLVQQDKLEKKARIILKQNAEEFTGEKQGSSDIEETLDLIKDYEREQDFLDVWPKLNTFQYVSIAAAVFSAAFMLTFVWGSSSASKQENHYFSDENHVVVSVFDSNVIAVAVEIEPDTNEYYTIGKYSLVPISDLKFELKKCGAIIAKKHQDEIALSFKFP